jgi:DNA-binding LacI/PurR family transcriptional regulator
MKIALDFDGTFTADPQLWRRFCAYARNAGHEVRIVSMRCEQGREEIEQMAGPWVDGIICTATKPKRRFAHALGSDPHVWIDDCPDSIPTPNGLEL